MKIFQVAELDTDNNRSDEENIKGAINAGESPICGLVSGAKPEHKLIYIYYGHTIVAGCCFTFAQ